MILNNTSVGIDLRDRTPMSRQFETVRRRVTEKKKQLEDIENEYELLQRQEFILYKNNISYDFGIFTPQIIKDARNWLGMKANGKDRDGKKLDGRRKYDEQSRFNMLEKDFKNAFGVERLEIVSIADFNFGQAWEIDFKIDDRQFMLRMPIIQHIKLDDYKREGCDVFMLALYRRVGCVISRVGCTYDERELKEIMKSIGSDINEDD